MLDAIENGLARLYASQTPRIDSWTGCDRFNPGPGCEALHGTNRFLLDHPGWLTIVVAFLGLLILAPFLRLIQPFVVARYRAWRDDDLWGRWMRPYEAYRARLFRPSGFLIGDLARSMILPLRHQTEASILTFGGAGTGKGAGLAITNCLIHRWQIIIDWGAQIVAVCMPAWTARGIRVVVVNPCRSFADHPLALPVYRFNPLAAIKAAHKDFGAKCRALAEALFDRFENEREPFWTDSSVAMVDFCLRQVLRTFGDQATLLHVYRAILGGRQNQKEFFAAMARSEDKFIRDAGKRLADLLEKGERTAASILQHVDSKLAWMADDRFVESLSGNDVDFDELRGRGTGAKGYIVVFVLPPHLAQSHSAWLKVCTYALSSALIDEIPENRVLITVDEAAIFKSWPFLEWSMANLRKYHMQMHLIYQSMGQSTALFGENFNSMMANAEIKNFIGVNDQLTANFLSEVLGETSDGVRLQTPEQLQRMRKGLQVTLVRGQRPILVQNRPYYHRFWMRRRVNPDPYHARTPRLPALYPLWVLKGLVVGLWATSRPTTRQAAIMALVLAGFWWGRQAWAIF